MTTNVVISGLVKTIDFSAVCPTVHHSQLGELSSRVLLYFEGILCAVPVLEVCMKLIVCMKMMTGSGADNLHEPAGLYYLNGVSDLICYFEQQNILKPGHTSLCAWGSQL